jgi:peptidoglycan/xylan/chitin deacetylase (PgdA/CDA1 family)
MPEEIFDAAKRISRMRPPVVITFDDGYRDYHDLAYPILRECKVPAAVFISTNFMDNGGLIWTERLHRAVMTTKKSSVTLAFMGKDGGGRTFACNDAAARRHLLTEVKLKLKGIADAERRVFLEQMLTALDVAEPERGLDRQMLSWDEIRATREGTSYGGHSHTHPILSQLSAEALDQEIRVCRDRMRAEIGVAPACFAYPNGRKQDFSDAVKETLKRYGFNLAFATIEGLIQADSDPMELHRQPANDSAIGNFATLVAGANSGLRSAQQSGY